MIIKFVTVLMLVLCLQAACPNDKRCLKCSGTTCEVCYKSFIDTTGGCSEPKDKVGNCLLYENSKNCAYCELGYYADRGECKKNGDGNCAIESKKDYCVACKYRLVAKNGECEKDTACSDSNCKICAEGGSVCLICAAGFTNHRGSCKSESVKNCMTASFSSASKCISCRYGYYDNGSACVASDLFKVEDEEKLLSAFLLNSRLMVILLGLITFVNPFN